jgi:hypothetical protein
MSLHPARSLLVYIDDPSACVHSHIRAGSTFSAVSALTGTAAAIMTAAAATHEKVVNGRIKHLP